MIDFKKMLTPEGKAEFKKRKQEQEEQECIEEELKNKTAHATGHRPNNKYMFGYDLSDPCYKPIINKTVEIIEMLINEEGIEKFISGGAIGYDTIFYWCVHKLKDKYPHIKNIVAVPFKNQPIKWNKKDQKWYYKMLEFADEVICVDEIEEYKVKNIPIGEYHVGKMSKRNQFMIDKSKVTVAYYNGSKGGTANTYRAANKIGRMIVRIDPRFDYNVDIFYGNRY